MYDCAIIGGGPAGITSAIYAARAGLKTVIIEKSNNFGGAMYKTNRIDNYPGFSIGTTGKELTESMLNQMKSFNVTIVKDRVVGVDISEKTKKLICINNNIETKSIIFAMGASKSIDGTILNVEGEEKFLGKGISYCGTCDAPFFKNMHIYVLGNNDEAAEEAIYLSDFGKKITMIINKEKPKISTDLLEDIEKHENIEIIKNKKIIEFRGEHLLEEFEIKDIKTNEITVIKPDEGDFAMGVFIFSGKPNSTNFLENIIELDNGSILVDTNMTTNIDGVFAAGDIIKKNLRQIVTATNDGAIAAMNSRKYIKKEYK